MKFIFIVGPPAVGKMTVGQALAKQTGYKLFHNHMSLELVNQFFDWGTPHFQALDKTIRFSIFTEVAKSDVEGLIFTLVWAFNEKEDEEYVDEIVEIFAKRNPEVLFVELKADLDERLKRNAHPNRLQHKPSKRDVEASNKRLLYHDEKYRMNSLDGEFPNKRFLKIDNTHLSPEEVGEMIVEELGLNR